MRDKDEREAVFWCGLLRPLLFGEIAAGEVAAWLRQIAAAELVFPDGQRHKPSLSTLKRKLRLYRQGGFAALPRKRRKDRGTLRAAPAEVVRTAIAAKREQPQRSAPTLNLILEQHHGKTVARSTLYRHLKAAGATRLKLGLVQEPVRKRWTCAHTHDLWVGDFADGPCVLLQGLSVRTYLSAFIDAHSRYVVAARYYLRESLDVLCDTLIRYQTLLVQQTPMEASSLLRLLVRTLNEKPGFGRDRLFTQILNKAQAADRSTLLLIDEAHLLKEAALTDLRLLLCAGLDDAPHLRLLLCGQDGLLQTLSRQSLADLLNRVTVRVHLAPLTKDQTVCYLDHRLKTVGGSDKLFGDDAKARLHDYAGGIPRLLNNLATLCLIQGAARKQKLINVALVDEAARELRML